jgi:predicted aspartyl protease
MPTIPVLKQHQQSILTPQLSLDLQCAPDSPNTKITRECLIDTGSVLPLSIDQETYKLLGSPPFAEQDYEIALANHQSLFVPIIYMDILLEGKILPIEAVILDKEEQPIIGTPLLKLICEVTESRFVMDFLRSIISFETN